MFLNLAMLAGIGAAVVPLVVHLLARARHKEVEWGAMMFLEGAAAPRTHAARLKQWLLLAMRMAMVGLLATALARPVLRPAQAGAAGGDAPASVVIVVDRSFSMGFEEAGRTRFDKAREAVLQILAGLRKGDEVALVLAGERVEVRPATSNLQTVAREAAELQVSGGAADFAEALQEAQRLLDRPAKLNRELYIVCDRQAASWRRLLAEPQSARWLNDARNPTRCSIVPVGGEDADNVAVMSLDLVESVAVRNHPAEVEVGVRNVGASPRVGMDLTLSIINAWGHLRNIKTVPVTVPAGGETSVRIAVTFDQGGSHVLSAQINAPGLDADNRLDSAIDVIEPVEVLIASGNEFGPDIRRESFFLRLALAPFQAAQKRGGDPSVVTVRSVEEWPAANLGKYHVIILANVPQITPGQARALEQRVYEGAGLIIAPGNLVRVDNYNAVLYRDGQGLMPARLDSAVAANGSDATGLLGMELTHPIFRFRRGGEALPGAVIGRYFPAVVRPSDARVLGTYNSGKPFLVEGPQGRGRVLLLTTPLDADWNMMPLYPFYLPFVQSMVRYAAAPALPPRNLSPGQALLASFDAPMEDVRLDRGGERLRDVTVTAGGTQARCEDTARPGIYRLSGRVAGPGGQTRVLHYVVAAPREESDLTPLSAEQWRQLRGGLGMSVLNPAQEALSRSVADQRSGSELWLPLLLGAIGLGLCEQVLTWLWGREAA